MGIKKVVESVKKEVRVIQGEDTKDKLYTSEQEYPDELSAKNAFAQSREKLFNVNAWSNLSGLSSTFQLHDKSGKPKQATKPQEGDYIWIDLPGPLPKNWVRVTNLHENENMINFTVSPSENPQEKENNQETKHFFTQDATSTFQVELQGKRIIAKEIGKDEAINNQGNEAGSRAMINTLIAEGGWAVFQKIQWQKITDYLVHKID